MVVLRAAPTLTPQEKEDQQRLWRTQTNDAQNGENTPGQIQKITTDCDNYMKRLYGFFFEFLKKHMGMQSRDTGGYRFLKDNLRESCLESFYSRFIERNEGGEDNQKRVRLNGEKVQIMLQPGGKSDLRNCRKSLLLSSQTM